MSGVEGMSVAAMSREGQPQRQAQPQPQREGQGYGGEVAEVVVLVEDDEEDEGAHGPMSPQWPQQLHHPLSRRGEGQEGSCVGATGPVYTTPEGSGTTPIANAAMATITMTTAQEEEDEEEADDDLDPREVLTATEIGDLRVKNLQF
jgi:hypothetical protein